MASDDYDPARDEFYDPDDVFPGRYSPLMRAVRVHRTPTPHPLELKDVPIRFDHDENEADHNGWPFEDLEIKEEDLDIKEEDEYGDALEENEISSFFGSPGVPRDDLKGRHTHSALHSMVGQLDLNHLPDEAATSGIITTSEGDSILLQSPGSYLPGTQITLPSIADQLGDINHLVTEGGPYSSSGYSTPSGNVETPSTNHPTPTMLIDQMSIDGIIDPQIGGYKCTYPGCTAQPFQTQYLLHSHANSHSSNRPHYCPVESCPRSEGGKGFKRKNEMIRHRLVHDCPGFVCPFCPDREHKYPRSNVLQR